MFVLDNSVLCGWFLQDQADAYTEAVAARLSSERACAPPLLMLEFANVLRNLCRRGRFSVEQANEAIDAVAMLGIDIDHREVPAAEIFNLAGRFDLTAYDAAYLQVALARRVPVATRDTAQIAAARAAGAGVVNESIDD